MWCLLYSVLLALACIGAAGMLDVERAVAVTAGLAGVAGVNVAVRRVCGRRGEKRAKEIS